MCGDGLSVCPEGVHLQDTQPLIPGLRLDQWKVSLPLGCSLGCLPTQSSPGFSEPLEVLPVTPLLVGDAQLEPGRSGKDGESRALLSPVTFKDDP